MKESLELGNNWAWTTLSLLPIDGGTPIHFLPLDGGG